MRPLHDFGPCMDCTRQSCNITEYRITVMDYQPVITLLKHKTIMVDNLIGKVNRYELVDVLYDSKLTDFCRAYPLEYGELDCIYFDDRFWIFDVNPTPGDAAFVNMPYEMSREYQNRYKHYLYTWLTRLI